MHKWWILLCVALLINCLHAQAQADENIYFTNKEDRYYHLDENCDRHPGTDWWSEAPVEYYEREIYRKMPISEAAAIEFDKQACPVCVKQFEPVYLGDHFPEWPFEDAPWEIREEADEGRLAFMNSRNREYKDEVATTGLAFYTYYEEGYNHETGKIERRHEYPEFFAGEYANASFSSTYRIVDPNEEILSAFKHMFGGGAWIVAAKYGYNEITDNCDRVVNELSAWCAAHPEVDARFSGASGPDYANYAVIGINGADWQQAAAAMEATAPIYIHFVQEENAVAGMP